MNAQMICSLGRQISMTHEFGIFEGGITHKASGIDAMHQRMRAMPAGMR